MERRRASNYAFHGMEGFENFGQAVPLYRRSGLNGRALAKALTLAIQFRELGELSNQKYCLHIARSLSTNMSDPDAKAVLALEFRRYHISETGRPNTAAVLQQVRHGFSMAIRENEPSAVNTLTIDFLSGATGYRLRQARRSDSLAKAVGIKNRHVPTIIDATAGLGRDAFLLASLGAAVTLIERSEKVHALLAEALKKSAAAGPQWAAIVERMTLVHADARELLPSMQAEVILVDPMHPPRKRLVKHDMRLLRDLVGPDEDALELMRVALACARDRVVLKWPRYAAPYDGIAKPSHQFLGKTTRYDVFLTRASSSAPKCFS
jgi:16S rRNA (guanine1516-N2)-methyltransferase